MLERILREAGKMAEASVEAMGMLRARKQYKAGQNDRCSRYLLLSAWNSKGGVKGCEK
jgi:hypothetical protein